MISQNHVPVLAFLFALLGFAATSRADQLPVTRVTFHAPSVAREMAFNIILPAGYDKNEKHYPVLYLLHGRKGDENYWVDLGAPKNASAYEMIVVMPSALPSWYVNWSASSEGQKNAWENYIVKDLIGYVDAHYRTIAAREGRAIGGKSMGGYGALILGLRNPDSFCSVSCIAGGLSFIDLLRDHLNGKGRDPLFLTGEVPIGKRELAENTPRGRMVSDLDDCDAIDPFKVVLEVPREQLPDIRIDCGLDDGLLDYSQRFARLLMEAGISFTFVQAPGAHTPEYGAYALRHTMPHQYAVMMNQLGKRDGNGVSR
ncbi:MAG: hypothetical protein KJT03_02165 [Verrucomicrobiae bacterium]|nr:hypothetical protein [Verrucomicrobiae bacterium]